MDVRSMEYVWSMEYGVWSMESVYVGGVNFSTPPGRSHIREIHDEIAHGDDSPSLIPISTLIPIESDSVGYTITRACEYITM